MEEMEEKDCLSQGSSLSTCWQCSRPMPRVAADEKIVLVLAKSAHLHQLLLLPHVRPAKELGSEHLGAHSAQSAQSQSTPWHQAAHPRVFPRTLQCPDKSFHSRFTKVLRRDRKMNMGDCLRGAGPAPEGPWPHHSLARSLSPMLATRASQSLGWPSW